MRVTQFLITNMARQRTDAASSAYAEAGRKASASSAVEKRSDDPVTASRVAGLDRFLHELDMLEKNRNTVQTELTLADTIVSSMQDAILNAKDIALAMSSDNLNDADRANSAVAVQKILDQIRGLANRQHPGGKYLFGGLAEDRPPFDDAGEYQGNDGLRMVEIGPGVSIEATVSGRDAFGPNQEVLTSLRGLIFALQNPTVPGDDTTGIKGIQNSLDRLEEARQTLSLARTEIGGRLAILNDVQALSVDLRTSVDYERSGLVAVDIARLAPELTTAKSVLEAVVETSKGLMSQTASWLR